MVEVPAEFQDAFEAIKDTPVVYGKSLYVTREGVFDEPPPKITMLRYDGSQMHVTEREAEIYREFYERTLKGIL